MTKIDSPDPSPLEGFAQLADLFANVRDVADGERASALARGYGESVAEQMAMTVYAATMQMLVSTWGTVSK